MSPESAAQIADPNPERDIQRVIPVGAVEKAVPNPERYVHPDIQRLQQDHQVRETMAGGIGKRHET